MYHLSNLHDLRAALCEDNRFEVDGVFFLPTLSVHLAVEISILDSSLYDVS